MLMSKDGVINHIFHYSGVAPEYCYKCDGRITRYTNTFPAVYGHYCIKCGSFYIDNHGLNMLIGCYGEFIDIDSIDDEIMQSFGYRDKIILDKIEELEKRILDIRFEPVLKDYQRRKDIQRHEKILRRDREYYFSKPMGKMPKQRKHSLIS